MNKLIVLFAILMSCSTLAHAETQLNISPTLLHFDYTEFSTTDEVLDRELGWLPGLEANLKHAITPDWLFSVSTSYYQGTVDYDGQTQQGAAHTTNTDSNIFRIGVRADRLIYQDIYLFAGARFHKWKRDINDNNNISGIDETYEWHEYSIGLNSDFTITQKDIISLEASLLLIRDGTIFVDLSRANLGTTTLDLGDGTGARLNLSWIRQYKNNINYGLGLFFEAWQFGRSNTRQTQNSSAIIFVTEPESETKNIGLQFSIEYMF